MNIPKKNITKNKKTNIDNYRGYDIKGINNFLELNNNEVLNEIIPVHSISNPFFSIIIPFTNCSKTLKKAIRSIQNQSFKSYEVILINDHSLDNSTIIIENLSSIDKRIKLVKNKLKYDLLLSRVIGMKFSKATSFIIWIVMICLRDQML